MLKEFEQLYIRRGKRISGTGLQLAEDLEEKLQRTSDFLESIKGKKHKEQLRESLDRQEEIIEIIFASEESGLKLGYMELMALLALRYGVGRELLAHARAFSTMARRHFFSKGGETTDLRRALYDDLVSRTQEVLKGYDLPHTSRDIVTKLGIDVNEINLSRISAALNLLETLGNVTRLPSDSKIVGSAYMWIHSDYRYSKETIPYWNLKYAILLALQEGKPLTINDLVANERIASMVSVRPAFGYKGACLYRALDDLIFLNMVDSKIEPVKKRGTTTYAITPYGYNLLRQTEENGYLNEELRIALLGEKFEGLKPSEEMALRRIKRVAIIYAIKDRRGALASLARRTGEKLRYVQNIRSGRRDPLRFFKEETLIQKFYPYLTDDEKRGLDIYLGSRKRKPNPASK